MHLIAPDPLHVDAPGITDGVYGGQNQVPGEGERLAREKHGAIAGVRVCNVAEHS